MSKSVFENQVTSFALSGGNSGGTYDTVRNKAMGNSTTKQYDDGRPDVTPKPNQSADERRTSFKIAQVSTKFGVENI